MTGIARAALLAGALAAPGCAVSDDPGRGGFLSGVAGLSSGAYAERIEAREQTVAAEERRQAALRAELERARRDYASARSALSRRRAAILARGTPVPPDLAREVDAALDRRIVGATDPERLARYRDSVREARLLAERLARL